MNIALMKKKEKDDAEKRKLEKNAAALNKRKAAYREAKEIIAQETDQTKWTMSHLRALISYKKQKTDNWALPKTKPLLIAKWLEVKDRFTPPSSPIRAPVTENTTESDEESEVASIIPIAQAAV